MSGGGSKSVTVGYKYYLGVHAAICHGPVDAVTEIIVGERQAWRGNVTASQQIVVNKPNLFGGEKREGGVAGSVDLMFGESTQGKNDYLVSLLGVNIPAYRGILSAVFRKFYWSAMNPYFKAPWFRVRRILTRSDGSTQWLPLLAEIRPSFTLPQMNFIARYGVIGEGEYGSSGAHSLASDGTNIKVLFSHGYIFTSSDSGTTWTQDEYDPMTPWNYSDQHRFIKYGGGRWIAGGPGKRMMYNDGEWHRLETSEVPFYNSITDAAYGNGRWIAVGENAEMAISTDGGESWTMLATRPVGWTASCIHFASGRWIAAGQNGRMYTSVNDGASWSEIATPFETVDSNVGCIVRENGYWVAGGGYGAVTSTAQLAYSADGLTWTRANTISGPSSISGIAFSDGVWICAGYYTWFSAPATIMLSSTNLSSWSTQSDLTGEYFTSITDVIGVQGAFVATTRYDNGIGPESTKGYVYRAPTPELPNNIDMNPAHIIRECLTDRTWGMGYSESDIGASFAVAAQKLYDEQFGMSMLWSEQASIQDFIGIVLDHINGTLSLDLATGKFELGLIRDDYDPEDLAILSPSNILEMRSFQRSSWGDTANEITVIYTGRNEQELSVTVQDPASIEAQGGVIPATREYRGIRDDNLAIRLAMRDLNTSSSNLAKVSLVCNRVAWNWNIGKVFSLTWPRLGLVAVPMRVVSINKGSVSNGRIEIEAVEDVFGLPSATYTAPQVGVWVDPINEPSPAILPRAIEAPYWDVVTSLSAADLDYLEPMYGFGQVIAAKPTSDAFDFEMHAAPATAGVFTQISSGNFCPGGTLLSELALPTGAAIQTVTLTNPVDLDLIDVGGYAYLDNEAVEIVSVNTGTSQIGITRGVLDTVPTMHATGTRLYFVSGTFGGDDPTQRVSGETVFYRPLTKTAYGVLALNSAASLSLTLNNRASRPYPPGQFKINGQYWPAGPIEGATLSVSWAHRDRLQQTVDMVDYTEGNVGPEVGTTYTVELVRVSDSAVLASASGLTGTSTTITPTDDGYVRLTVKSVRDGLDSWQSQTHEFEYVRGESRVTEDGDIRITEAGETRIME